MPRIRPGIDKRNCFSLQFIGTLPSNNRLKHSEIDRRRNLSCYSKYYGPFCDALIELAGDEFYINVPTPEAFELVIKSWDDKPNYDFEDMECFPFAKSFLDMFYGHKCENPIASNEEVFSWMDMARSGGYLATFFGLRTKRDTIQDPGYRAWAAEHDFIDPDIWSGVLKKEYLPKESLDRKKARVFCIPSVFLTFIQLKYGKRISNKLKNFKWSAYGFNPYSGGCDKLARALNSKPIRLYYDVSGWDKFIPLLRNVYAFIEKAANVFSWSPQEQKEFKWMVDNTCEFVIKLYDGTVYKKTYGNGSGQGSTTRDNIFCHILIIATLLCTIYKNKHGKFPNPNYICEQIVKLFGDDCVMALDYGFEQALDQAFMANFFGKFGLKLKFLYGGVDFDIQNMQFLGFNFFKVGDNYIPRYDERRLATTMVYDGVDHLNREAFISRLFVLTLMSYPCPNHAVFLNAARQAAKTYSNFSDLTPTEQVLTSLILKANDNMFLNTFLGLEGSNSVVLEAIFSTGNLEAVGIKDFFPQFEECLKSLPDVEW